MQTHTQTNKYQLSQWVQGSIALNDLYKSCLYGAISFIWWACLWVPPDLQINSVETAPVPPAEPKAVFGFIPQGFKNAKKWLGLSLYYIPSLFICTFWHGPVQFFTDVMDLYWYSKYTQVLKVLYNTHNNNYIGPAHSSLSSPGSLLHSDCSGWGLNHPSSNQ